MIGSGKVSQRLWTRRPEPSCHRLPIRDRGRLKTWRYYSKGSDCGADDGGSLLQELEFAQYSLS